MMALSVKRGTGEEEGASILSKSQQEREGFFQCYAPMQSCKRIQKQRVPSGEALQGSVRLARAQECLADWEKLGNKVNRYK